MLPEMEPFFSEFADLTGANSIRTLELFFHDFYDLTANKTVHFQTLLNEFEPISTRMAFERMHLAPRFNIFSALGIDENEVLASRFLAYLLDPRQSHDQGALFLLSFLRCVLNEEKEFHHARRARVIPERSAGEYGRLDISIEFPDGQIVVIENKINAEERPRQIEDYQTWLSRQRGSGHAVIFLTLTGRRPETAKDDGAPVYPLSYTKLSEWLLTVPVPDRIGTVIQQFCNNFA